MAKSTISTVYLGYACYPPFVVYGTLDLHLRNPLNEEEAKERAQRGNFTVDDFEENFQTELSTLPTRYKYIFSVQKYCAESWALNEALYGE